MKLCKDCKHCRKNVAGSYFDRKMIYKCAAPKLLDPVSGELKHECEWARKLESMCGQDAKYFEAKEKE